MISTSGAKSKLQVGYKRQSRLHCAKVKTSSAVDRWSHHPYVFDFLTLTEPAREKELEDKLLAHVERFLLELGAGFAWLAGKFGSKSAARNRL
jgi:predicted nuclease of restriction endonuclease-like (RecB) superfamily